MIDFLEEEHVYLLDGVIIPSVSEILHFIFPDKYKNINLSILNKKAEYGAKVHEAIECLEKGQQMPSLDLNQEFSLRQYLRLKEKNDIKVKVQEQIIHYKSEYAGRFDMIATINNELCLCDIKTTATLDEEYLSWQLSFYELAFKSMYGTGFEKLYAIWLPKKDYGKLIEIKRKTIAELLNKLEEFKKEYDNDIYRH